MKDANTMKNRTKDLAYLKPRLESAARKYGFPINLPNPQLLKFIRFHCLTCKFNDTSDNLQSKEFDDGPFFVCPKCSNKMGNL